MSTVSTSLPDRSVTLSESSLYGDELFLSQYRKAQELLNQPISQENPTSYFDPEKQELVPFTIGDVLGGGSYIAKTTTGVPSLNIDVNSDTIEQVSQQKAITDPQNYIRLLTIQSILSSPERVEEIYNRRGLSREQLEDMLDVDQLNQYGRKLARERQLSSSQYKYRDQDSVNRLSQMLEVTAPVGGKLVSDYVVEPVSNYLYNENELQRAELVYRGVAPEDVDKYYMEGQSFPLEFYTRTSLSPLFPTANEFKNIVLPFDPEAEVFQIDPRQGGVEKGLLIRSPKYTNNRLVRVGSVQPFSELTEGDADAFVQEFNTILAQEGVEIAAGGAFVKLARDQVRKRFQARMKKAEGKLGDLTITDESPLGQRLAQAGKDVVVSSLLTAGGETAFRLGRLALGKQKGVQPELTFDRALEDSGALFYSTLLYGGMGDAFIRAAAGSWKLVTGRPVPSDLIDRLILRRKKQEELIRGKTPNDVKEGSRDETQQIIRESIEEQGERYGIDAVEILRKMAAAPLSVKQQRTELQRAADEIVKSFNTGTAGISLGQASQDQVIQALEEQLALKLLGSRTPGAARLQQYAENEAILLDEFYQTLIDGIDADPVNFPSKEQVNKIFTGIQKSVLEDRLTDEQISLAEAAAKASVLNVTGKITRDERAAAASDVQENVITNDVFPDRRSRLLQFNDEKLQQAQATLDEVKALPEYNSQENAIPIKKYIDKEVAAFANVNKEIGILGTSDAKEAEDIIRDIIPNNEAGGTSLRLLTPGQPRELIPSPVNPEKMIEGGKFLQLKRWTPREILDTRENLYALFYNHPNPVARKHGMAIVAGLDRAYEEQLRKMYRNRTGAARAPSLAEVKEEIGGDYDVAFMALEDARRESSGRYINQILQQPESKIGDYVLTSNPDEVSVLVSLLSQQPDGLKKLENVKTLVLDSIRNQVSNRFAESGKEASRFNSLLRKNEEQLRALFPEEFVDFENFASFMRTSEQAVKASKRNLAALEKELETVGAKNITDVLDNFFNMSADRAKQFRGSTAEKQLRVISDIADQYPQLRTAIQGYFKENIIAGLRGDLYEDTMPQAQRMLMANDGRSTFDFKALQRMFSGYGSHRELADVLRIFVGPDEALPYARKLRTLATRINQQKGFLGSPLSKYRESVGKEQGDIAAATQRKPRGEADIAFIRKLVSGPLSHTNYALGLLTDFSNLQRAKYIAEIVSDPAKLDAYMAAENRRLPALLMAKIVHALYMGRSVDPGAEDKEREIDAIRREAANLSQVSEDDAFEALMRVLTKGNLETYDAYVSPVVE